MIDYTKVSPIHDYLASNYGSRPFDAILDTVGQQELYKHSASYVKQDGVIINVGTPPEGGPIGTVLRMAKNTMLPSMLGGIPRRFHFFSAALSGEGAADLAKFVEEGTMTVRVESVFKLEDVLEVSLRISSRSMEVAY